MKKTLDRLKFQGENCADYNRNKAISEQQLKTIFVIEKYFDDEFKGSNFGEAWGFILSYINRTYRDGSGQEKGLLISGKMDEAAKWEDFIADNYEIIRVNSIDFQEDYFNQRHDAMLRGKSWDIHDKYDDSEEPYEEKKEIFYEVNKDDEQTD